MMKKSIFVSEGKTSKLLKGKFLLVLAIFGILLMMIGCGDKATDPSGGGN